MNSSRAGESLSLRLKALRSYYSGEKHVWDIGCDHADLGLSFVNGPVESIYLVDPSIHVVNSLLEKLKASYISNEAIKIIHSKGQNLIIEPGQNCIFIAGMGGQEIKEIIGCLLPQLDATSRIVISPHRKVLELRAYLRELPVALHDEKVLIEDGQFYQILCLIPNQNGRKVSLYGEGIWGDEVGQLFREHQVKYFGLHQDLASVDYVTYLLGPNCLKLTPP